MVAIEQPSLNLYDACREDFILPDNCLNIGTSNVEIKRIRTLKTVDNFLNDYHYLHSGDNRKSVAVITRAYGLYLGGDLAGVAVYNPPGSKAIVEYIFGRGSKETDLRRGTLALSRLVTHPDAPFNATGYLISQSLKMLREDNRERLNLSKAPYNTIITFADTLFHTGTTYRAVNAWYYGKSQGGGLGGFYNPETGDIIHVRQGKTTLNAGNCPSGWKPLKLTPKLRYIFFVGTKREQLSTMRRLDEQVKFSMRIGSLSVLRNGRLAKLSDKRCYDEVYKLFGGRGTNHAGRYINYLGSES